MGARRFIVLSATLMLGMIRPGRAEDLPTYSILRCGGAIEVDGRLDEPAWLAAPHVGPFQFPWWEAGKKEQTIAKLLYDDRNLYVGYLCQDAHISAEHKDRDSAVYLDDCVEVFVAPDAARPNAYFNIEMNVLGAFLDQFHPAGPGAAVKEEWNAAGVRIATRISGTLNDDSDEDSHWTLEVAIPLDNYARALNIEPPKPGDTWRVGLNRCGGRTNPQHSQWSPSNTPKPAFHVPARFGKMIFADRSSPF